MFPCLVVSKPVSTAVATINRAALEERRPQNRVRIRTPGRKFQGDALCAAPNSFRFLGQRIAQHRRALRTIKPETAQKTV